MICGRARTWSSKMRVAPGVVPAQGGEHVQLEGEPGRFRIELGPDDPDHSGLLQRAHPVQRGGRGEARQPGQFDVGPVRIGLQRSQELEVNFIKVHGHETE